MIVVIAYDIQSNQRRSKIEKLLRNHGQRVNYSVFECDIKKDVFDELVKKIRTLMNEKRDRIVFYRLCKECHEKSEYVGVRKPESPGDYISL